MRKVIVVSGAIAAALVMTSTGASAGPWEDGMVAYNRGDYIPAMRLFRPLAEAGNPKAQSQMGTMYRKGEGVRKSAVRAFMWFSAAARRGDGKAKAEMQAVSKAMSPDELSHARQMAEVCEASDYRNCEY
jgi:TPR repeat protein